MMPLASFAWDDDPVERVTRSGAVVSTTTRHTQVIEVDFAQLHPIPVGARLLTDFLAEFEALPDIAAHRDHANAEVAAILAPEDGRETLATLRRARGLSQKELAAIMAVSQPMISEIEAGRRSPSLPTLRSLARALQVDLNALDRVLPDA